MNTKINDNKIIIPLFGAKYHGGIRIIFGIANKLANDGIKVLIICPKNSWNPIYKLNPRVEVELLNIDNIFNYSLRMLFYFYIKNNCIFLLSHWLSGFLYSIVPSTKTSNSIYFVQDSEEVFFKKTTFFGKILRILVFYGYKNSSSNFIVTTNYGERKLKVITKNKIVNINKIILGVDKNIFYPNLTPNSKKTILFFPRKGWFKDFELLLSTFQILYNNKDLIDYNFCFISQEKELFNNFFNLPRVKCLSINSDKDLRDIYNESDILIHTSKYEGICLPILEALSCGTYVIATNSFGPLTYLTRKNSTVINIRNPDLIVQKAVHYLKNERIPKTIISDSVKEYSIDIFIENFSNKIKNLL